MLSIAEQRPADPSPASETAAAVLQQCQDAADVLGGQTRLG